MNLIAKKKLMQTLSPLPLQGRSCLQPIAAMAWLFVAFIIFWVGVRAHELKEEIHAPLAISVVICLLGLCVFAYYMWFGATRITENGIEQDWLFKRFIEWD